MFLVHGCVLGKVDMCACELFALCNNLLIQCKCFARWYSNTLRKLNKDNLTGTALNHQGKIEAC